MAVCIPREWAAYFLILLLLLILLGYLLGRRRRIVSWKDKIKDARLWRAEEKCPRNLVKAQRENMERYPDDYAQVLERNAAPQGVYSRGRELLGQLKKINEALIRKKTTYEKLGTTEEEFKATYEWFEKNYRIKRE